MELFHLWFSYFLISFIHSLRFEYIAMKSRWFFLTCGLSFSLLLLNSAKLAKLQKGHPPISSGDVRTGWEHVRHHTSEAEDVFRREPSFSFATHGPKVLHSPPSRYFFYLFFSGLARVLDISIGHSNPPICFFSGYSADSRTAKGTWILVSWHVTDRSGQRTYVVCSLHQCYTSKTDNTSNKSKTV